MSIKPAWVRPLAWLATAFALGVIVFGAFVRLSNAGLSCPDWPTCYGQVTIPLLTRLLLFLVGIGFGCFWRFLGRPGRVLRLLPFDRGQVLG